MGSKGKRISKVLGPEINRLKVGYHIECEICYYLTKHLVCIMWVTSSEKKILKNIFALAKKNLNRLKIILQKSKEFNRKAEQSRHRKK